MKFKPPELDDIPVEFQKQPAKHPKKKEKLAIANAQAFAQFGVQVLRVKARVLAALGKEAEQCGIKQIGHGKILLASDNAEAAINTLGGIVEKLLTAAPTPDYAMVVEIMRLQKEFNGQLILTAQSHFAIDKQPSNGLAANSVTVAYPSGSPVMVGIGKTQAAIEQKPAGS